MTTYLDTFMRGTLTGLRGVRRHLFLPDASQSMSNEDFPPTRLDAAFAAQGAYIAQLLVARPDDEVAIIAYSEESFVVCPWTRVSRLSDVDKRLPDWLSESRTRGMGNTNIAAGLQDALDSARAYPGEMHVVLLSDGEHNEGPEPLPVAKKLKMIATLTTVGIAGGRPETAEDFLREAASLNDDGSPRYRWVGDRERLTSHYVSLAHGICRI